jgi:hypothetical protein
MKMRIMLMKVPISIPSRIPVAPIMPAERRNIPCICFQLAPRYRTMLISLRRSKTRAISVLIIPIRETAIDMNSIA